jgi:hypothetical protein
MVVGEDIPTGEDGDIALTGEGILITIRFFGDK